MSKKLEALLEQFVESQSKSNEAIMKRLEVLESNQNTRKIVTRTAAPQKPSPESIAKLKVNNLKDSDMFIVIRDRVKVYGRPIDPTGMNKAGMKAILYNYYLSIIQAEAKHDDKAKPETTGDIEHCTECKRKLNKNKPSGIEGLCNLCAYKAKKNKKTESKVESNEPAEPAPLNTRETEWLEWWQSGMSHSEIAEGMGIKKSTSQSYRQHVMKKGHSVER